MVQLPSAPVSVKTIEILQRKTVKGAEERMASASRCNPDVAGCFCNILMQLGQTLHHHSSISSSGKCSSECAALLSDSKQTPKTESMCYFYFLYKFRLTLIA